MSDPEATAAGDDAELQAEVAALREEVERLRAEVSASRQFLAQVMDAEDAARRRIAQLIHDDALQTLLAANQELIEAAPGRAQVTRAHEVVSDSIARLREAVLALHPVTLEQGGFEHALAAVSRQAERQGSMLVEVNVAPEALGVNDELALAIARELLGNAARHSRASAVQVSIEPADDGAIAVEVRDDGRGVESGAREGALAAGHIGLASVTQRAEASGGSFKLAAGEDGGTVARVVIGSG